MQQSSRHKNRDKPEPSFAVIVCAGGGMRDAGGKIVKALREQASELLAQSVGKNLLPVDLNVVAEHLGMFIAPLPETHRQYSGAYESVGGTPTAYYNPNDSLLRQRFTIAHEIAHHCLNHGPSLRDPSANYSFSNSDFKEVEANKFAAEILMPAKKVRDLNEVGYSLVEMARLFQVSETAMLYRLKNLRFR